MVGRDSVEPKRPATICGPARPSLALPKSPARLSLFSPYQKDGGLEIALLGTWENARITENISNAGPVSLSNQTG